MTESSSKGRKPSSYGRQQAAEMKLLCWWCDEAIPRGDPYIRVNVGNQDLLFHPKCDRERRKS